MLVTQKLVQTMTQKGTAQMLEAQAVDPSKGAKHKYYRKKNACKIKVKKQRREDGRKNDR